MHARELIELAAFVAAEKHALVAGGQQVPKSALAQYWTASKCRLDRWGRALRDELKGTNRDGDETDPVSRDFRTLCEEILASEMLTRVWSAVLALLDAKTGGAEAQPVAASVLAGHIEISTRVLSVISTEQHLPGETIRDINRLRRLTERWTDLLLGNLNAPRHALALAHNTERAQDFTDDFSRHQTAAARQQSWALLRASLRAAFARRLQGHTPNYDLNGSIASAILGCFPAEAFDSIGVYHSLWLQKLSTTAADTQLLIAELLDTESGDSTPVEFGRSRQ
jgi:hypothetical protein